MDGKGLIIALFLALGAGGGGILSQQRHATPSAKPIPQSASQRSSSCQNVYGGGATCVQTGKVILNKTVQHPSSSQLVDSLSINDTRFEADQPVVFHLTLTNTDTQIVKNVTVQDTMPQLLRYVSGDGQFDTKANVFSFTIDQLNPGESKTRAVHMKVLPAEKLPKQPDTTCILNQATASFGNGNVSEDNAQLCIANRVLGIETSGAAGPTVLQPAQRVTKTPPTGASDLALLLLLPAGFAGLLMRKRAATNS